MSLQHAWAIVVALEMLAATMNRTCHTRMNNGHVLVPFLIPAAPYLVATSLFFLFLVVLSPFFLFPVALFRVAHVHVAHVHAAHAHAAHVRAPVALALSLAHVHVRVLFPAIDVPFRPFDRPMLVAIALADLAKAAIMVHRTYALDSRNIDAEECGEHPSFGTLILDREIRHIAMHSD